jgi:IS1 family transposase
MNKLAPETRVQILTLLCEGNSMRSCSRIADVSINTVTKLLIEAGQTCAKFHDETVRDVKASRVQCDEIWSFNYAKQKNVAKAKAAPLWAGDVWTRTAIEADTKLILSYFIGGREIEDARAVMDDLKSRVSNRIQLTTDGHRSYWQAVESTFGDDIDYAQLVKVYGRPSAQVEAHRRYSPTECIGTHTNVIAGDPDQRYINTSYVERSNLSMRTFMKRFTRLSLGFSKKVEHHAYMVALYAVWYNFVKMHKTLRMTPAMAAGVSDKLMDMTDLVALMDVNAPTPAKRGVSKKRAA